MEVPYNRLTLTRARNKMKTATELTTDDFNETFKDINVRVEDSDLIFNTNPKQYAAMYSIYCEDDDSFPDEESRYATVFVHYTRTGKLVIEI
jgi:hypothetical protein